MSNVFKLSISAYILICCRVRRKIQTGDHDISEDFFLTCLYPRGIGNPEDVELGFLRSGLLVKVAFPFSSTSELLPTNRQTFCALFTSPSSSEAFDQQESEEGPSRKAMKTASQRKATKSNVATLLRMDGKVTPRAIAYAATLVCRSYDVFLVITIQVYSLSSIYMTHLNGLKNTITSTSGVFTTSSSISLSRTVMAVMDEQKFF